MGVKQENGALRQLFSFLPQKEYPNNKENDKPSFLTRVTDRKIFNPRSEKNRPLLTY